MGSRYSKVQTSIWHSKKFNALNPTGKGDFKQKVYVYLLTCPHGNSAGFFRLPEGYATTDIRCSIQRYRNALKKIVEVGLIEIDGEIIFVRQFLNFNPYTNPSHAKGSKKEIEKFESSKLYPLFYEDVSTHCPEYADVFNLPEKRVLTACGEGADSLDTDRDYQDLDLYQDQDQEEYVPTGTAPDSHQDVYDHYLTLGLIQHRGLTKEMRNAIDIARRRGGYDWNMLKTLLDRHAYVVKLTAGNGDFKVHQRGITKFFGQKVNDGTGLICSEYADDGEKWLRYKDGNPSIKQDNKKTGTFGDFSERDYSEDELEALIDNR